MNSRPILLCRQRGVSIITAVFLLLLFAGLALYMLWITSAQNRGAAQDVQGARAYQAARSGVEWGLYRLLRDGQCAASTSLTFAGSSLSEYTSTVSCLRTADTDELLATNPVRVYEIVATACNHPVGGTCVGIDANGADYVERQIRVSTECVVNNGIPAACP